MGDFNCVLRNDEKKGGREPRTSVINDFSDWMDDNDLFEADFLGSKFTWANGQSGDPEDISKLNTAKAASVTLQEIRAQQSILLKQRSRNLWLTDGANEELFHYDHNIISSEYSQRMDEIPTMEEIKTVVFDLGADSAPGPDGFSGCFYRHCWDVIQQDLYKAITFCWQEKLIPQATRLGSVLDNLVSEEQVALIKGRNIHENISVASEMVNELKTKRKDGNVGLKLDITQDFDTILSSAHISILLNSIPEGFFKINRGLRQGDPLSPLIFVLIEDVLSRNISKLFLENKMTPMLSKKKKCNMKSLHNLLALLGKYQTASGQTVCRQKSKVYYGGGSLNRCTTITNLLSMEVSTFPDRIVLINSVIASYSIHNMVVYKWPLKFIKQAERVIRNFLWSGDAEVSRKFVVGFKALLMKLWWNIRSSNKKWARFLWAKYTSRLGRLKQYGVKSSILPDIRIIHSTVDKNTKVLLGDGRSTYLYFDVWNGNESIADMLGENDLDGSIMVSDIIVNNNWQLQGAHVQQFVRAGVDLTNLPVLQGGEDCRVWMPEMNGTFSNSSAK
ncbi:uncharacterized protein LOC113343061 [Papaver somniferum]|uniref:uncharacterized protein LOC113343061 n=1 Tax=Papaver somniferum TaxID=3469 RepID=UPI000E7047C6|nr:uncharacterized protein LOC113343061 [Papaver somniferum]